MFSKACEYAIRAVIFIAQQSERGLKAGIKDIAQGTGTPEPFIAKILQDLGREGIVQSSKGPHGGFYLDAQSKKNTLADVVRAIDGDRLFKGCALGLKDCSEKKPCPLHDEFKVVRARLQKILESANVAEFNRELDLGLTYLKR